MPAPSSSPSSLYIGLMSGTSLDGVDGVISAFGDGVPHPGTTIAAAYQPFDAALRAELLALQAASDNEIHRENIAAGLLAHRYADCVRQLLAAAGLPATAVRAIGVHGQTIRHRPECGYTRQIHQPALLAELTGIDIVTDFRSRDIAAGGQGAPLVPAFHHALFGKPGTTRVVANIGGIANISILDAGGTRVIGFDTGPGNVLMDLWIGRHRQQAYDANGAWAAAGTAIDALLAELRSDPFFALPPPKSTGRDLFHADWLDARLAGFAAAQPVDVQATLAELTAVTLADAIARHAPDAAAVYVCGGGAYNTHLLRQLQSALAQRRMQTTVATTDALGIAPNHVEALAFAWLAYRFTERQPGNLPAVTGARGPRILGALYPA